MAELHGEVQAATGEEGEGVRGVERHGRDDGIDLALEEVGEPEGAFARQLLGLHEAYAVGAKLLEDEREAAIDRAVLAVRLARDGVHLLLGGKPRDVSMLDAALDEVLDSCDADHEELV